MAVGRTLALALIWAFMCFVEVTRAIGPKPVWDATGSAERLVKGAWPGGAAIHGAAGQTPRLEKGKLHRPTLQLLASDVRGVVWMCWTGNNPM